MKQIINKPEKEKKQKSNYPQSQELKAGDSDGKKAKKLSLVVVSVLIVVVVLAVLMSRSFSTSDSKREAEKILLVDSNTSEAKVEAIEVATSFLKKQDFSEDYHLEAVKVVNNKEFWNVWFDKKDQDARPNKGLVQVSKETGEAEWKELY